jgi:methenyltetrahydrofolate cyclohydrolase
MTQRSRIEQMSTDHAMPIAKQTVQGYLNALNSKYPIPGGGAVAGTTGATAAAIAGMVIHYTLGKKKYEHCESENQSRLDSLTSMQNRFLQLADDDARGYGLLNALWSLPENNPKRVEGWDDAVESAITPPISMLELSAQLMGIVHELTTTTNRQLKSDLAVAAITGKAAAHNAACNIRINIPLLPDANRNETESSMNDYLSLVNALHDQILETCA